MWQIKRLCAAALLSGPVNLTAVRLRCTHVEAGRNTADSIFEEIWVSPRRTREPTSNPAFTPQSHVRRLSYCTSTLAYYGIQGLLISERPYYSRLLRHVFVNTFSTFFSFEKVEDAEQIGNGKNLQSLLFLFPV
jgi:hypothetical protein